MSDNRKIIAVGSDHAGFDMKEDLKSLLAELGYEVADMGTYSRDSCDYPEFGAAVAHEVASGKAGAGVLVCSTGIGISISANKVDGIRAALCHTEFEAEMTRRHNDANIICFGANVIGPSIARACLTRFLATDFEGGRHERRVNKITAIENNSL